MGARSCAGEIYLYHALIVLYFSYPQLGRFCSFEEVTDRYGMQDSIDAFQKFQKLFEQLALDDAQIIMENAFRVMAERIIFRI